MKIIHFSDIHIGGHLDSFKSCFDKRLIGTLNYKLRRKRHVIWERLERAIDLIKEEKPDYVINTGDITSVSEPSEFKEAERRLKKLTTDESFNFLNVPGNHDYYINNQRCLSQRNDTYDLLNRNNFKLADLPLKIEDENATFILVDESRPNPSRLSSGFISDEVIQKVEHWADESTKPVILVGHYPLKNKLGEALSKRRSLENSEGLLSMLENGKINVTLCGHIHAAFCRKEASGSLEICAGSLTIGGKLNKLEFDKSSGKFNQSWIDLK